MFRDVSTIAARVAHVEVPVASESVGRVDDAEYWRLTSGSYAVWLAEVAAILVRGVEKSAKMSPWAGKHSSSGARALLASNRSQAESPTTCGASASTITSRSVVSVPGATLISCGKPSSSNTSTAKA
jgi:hypothetical protein